VTIKLPSDIENHALVFESWNWDILCATWFKFAFLLPY